MYAEDSHSWCCCLEPPSAPPPERKTDCWLNWICSLFPLPCRKTRLDSDFWFSFLLTYHLTDGERTVLTLAFWTWKKKVEEEGSVRFTNGHDRLSNFWVYCSHQHSSELTSNYLDECAYAGVHVNEYVCVVDCVPQWCWGQQCPGMAVWTRERPGAQLTDDSGHRLTSQTAIKGTKYEYYSKVR